MSFCPCSRRDSEGDMAGSQAMKTRVEVEDTFARDPVEAEEEEEIDQEIEDDDQEIGLLGYESLFDLAVGLWRSASQFLQPEEADEYNEKAQKEMKRMNTIELRDTVKAAKNINRAMDQVLESGDAEGRDVARVQRASVGDGEAAFDGNRFARQLEEALNEDGTIVAYKFINSCEGVMLLMGGLGRTFEFANADLVKKIRVSTTRMEETAEELGKDLMEVTVQDIVERDIRNGVTHAGKKAGPGSRMLLRLLWMVDLVKVLLYQYAKNPDDDLKKSVSFAYEEVLADRHIWVLRKASRSGMRLVPSKQVFRKRLGTAHMDTEEEAALVMQWSEACAGVSDAMWEFYKSKGLEKLP